MSSAASITPRDPHDAATVTSPSNGVDGPKDEEHEWSGDAGDEYHDDDDNDDDDNDNSNLRSASTHQQDGDAGNSTARKRKRRATTGGDDGGNSRPTSTSCETCKTRKVKCDRQTPSCGWCMRNGQVCTYAPRKKPGLRAGYGRELEARLDKLEGVLQNQQNVLQQLANVLPAQQGQAAPNQHTSPSQHVPQAETALFMQTPNMYAGQHTSQRFNAITPQLPRDMSQQHNQHHQSQQTHHQNHPSQPSLQMAQAAPDDIYAANNPPLASPSLNIPGGVNNGAANNGVSLQPGTINTVSQDQDFPPYDLLYALTDLFFKHINTWCPILHRRSTLDSLFGPTALEEADRILLHAIVATTLRFSADHRLDAQSRDRYHSISKQKVLLYGLENSSVKALQALVILALDIVGNSNGPPGWNLLALITRSVVQLGLAVETTSTSVAPVYPSIYTLRAMVLPESRSFIEDESRRRLFWMVYLLDRYATVSTAFEFALDEKEIDRKLPCHDELFTRNEPVDTRWFPTPERTDYSMNKPENLGSFSYYIEIVGILSQIHRFLKKPVDIGALTDVEQWQQEYRELDSKLNAWRFSLPGEYGNMSRVFTSAGANKNVNSTWIMLHMMYHTTTIRLHSSAAYPTTRSPIFTPSYSASQRCHTAVEDICALCTFVRNNGFITKLGPPFAFSLWVAARLLLVHGSTIDHQVNPAIQPLVETLREIGVYWKVGERYATLLQRVMDEYRESERAPIGANGERVTPSTVRILADMRRCAYDLDFLISRQPRQFFGGKTNTVTPARTPAPNELEYLDVFDFFNMPRLPYPAGGDAMAGASGLDSEAAAQEYPNLEGNANEFNITNFMYDANSDWFMKNPN